MSETYPTSPPPRVKDITNQRFGTLTVVRFDHVDQHRMAHWLCRCDCGVEKTVAGMCLRNGDTKTCKVKGNHAPTHTPTWECWYRMHRRCRDPKLHNYHRYGGRGIKVCKRWSSFENFLEDMGEQPFGMTLDRKDGDKDYSPDNCQWATWSYQRRNQKRCRLITAKGKTLLSSDWEAETGIPRTTIESRIRLGWSAEDAVSVRPKTMYPYPNQRTKQ